MLIFTPRQIEEILNIIDKHHALFITTNIGVDYLSQNERRVLEDAGVDIEKWKSSKGKIEEAFGFGMLASAISDERAKKMRYKDFKKFVQSKNYFPLTTKEKAAIDHLKYQSFSDVKALSGRVKNDVSGIILAEDKKLRSKYEEITRQAAINTVEMRGSVRDMVSEIGKKTGLWERDLGRVAEYTLHSAYQEGRAAQFEQEHGDDPDVYKDVFPGACKHCVRLYLTAGIGSKPRVFKLSQLRSNGTNIGRKVDDWKAVVGGTHPYCRCELTILPEGYVWDDDKKAFVMGRYKAKNERVRNRKKVLVTIGNETHMV